MSSAHVSIPRATCPNPLLATGHQVYQLPSERHLEYEPDGVKFVLLLGSEFDHWPAEAPTLIKVSAMQDEFGDTRVLARTPGVLPWTLATRPKHGRNTATE